MIPSGGATLPLFSATVNWPLSLGSAALASLALIDTVVGSSSWMVAVAVLLVAPIAAPALLVPASVTLTVSADSTTLSSRTSTAIVAEEAPAGMVTVPGRVV